MQLQFLFNCYPLYEYSYACSTGNINISYVRSYMSSIQYTNILLYVFKFSNFAYHAKLCMQSTKKKNMKQLNVCLKLQGYQVLHSFNNKVNFTSGDARVTRVRVHVTRKYCS